MGLKLAQTTSLLGSKLRPLFMTLHVEPSRLVQSAQRGMASSPPGSRALKMLAYI